LTGNRYYVTALLLVDGLARIRPRDLAGLRMLVCALDPEWELRALFWEGCSKDLPLLRRLSHRSYRPPQRRGARRCPGVDGPPLCGPQSKTPRRPMRGLRAHKALKAHTSPRCGGGLGRIRRLKRTLPPAPPRRHSGCAGSISPARRREDAVAGTCMAGLDQHFASPGGVAPVKMSLTPWGDRGGSLNFAH
jgi:hypothetical protein